MVKGNKEQTNTKYGGVNDPFVRGMRAQMLNAHKITDKNKKVF
jgi:hypothetical protein